MRRASPPRTAARPPTLTPRPSPRRARSPHEEPALLSGSIPARLARPEAGGGGAGAGGPPQLPADAAAVKPAASAPPAPRSATNLFDVEWSDEEQAVLEARARERTA